ncbi:tetratricopeptide repeat protein [Blastopirellula marina]|uniref:tetratricopeptide repeat protein n=1 Tax=Blastopirellula marina TaxID=124 RepID=UPI0011B08EEE|nr:hypothetical protein [Blastopirellula marina]
MAFQKLYRCVALWGFLLAAVSLCPLSATAQGNLPERDKWVTRLKENATQALADMDKSDAMYDLTVRQVANMLVLTGRYDEVWPWIEKHQKLTVEHYLLVAQWFSSVDQVDYALKLADSLADDEKPMAMRVIAGAQAKRGGIQDAINLLPKISDADPHAKNFARYSIATAYAKAGKYDDAEKLLPTITDVDVRQAAETVINEFRKRRTPGEPGYSKFKAEYEKNSFPPTAGVMRWVAEAEVALAKGNKPLAGRHLMKASEMLRKIDPDLTTSATIEIAQVAEQAGMTDLAIKAFRHAVETDLNTRGVSWDGFRDAPGHANEAFDAFARVIPTEEVERMIQRSQNNPLKKSLTANLIAVLVKQGELEKASQFYQGQASPAQKYEISQEVLEHAFGLRFETSINYSVDLPLPQFLY